MLSVQLYAAGGGTIKSRMWRRGMVFWQLTIAKGSALLARFRV